jgi:hypothetical protein
MGREWEAQGAMSKAATDAKMHRRYEKSGILSTPSKDRLELRLMAMDLTKEVFRNTEH